VRLRRPRQIPATIAPEAETVVTPRSAVALRQLRAQAAVQARRARRQALLVVALLGAVIVLYSRRDEFPRGWDVPVRVGAVVAVVILGWALARDLGRAFGPRLLDRLEPSTAGTAGFLIRLLTLGATVIVALALSGLRTETLAVGGAVAAVVVGLAAQQTLGNLIAGLMLLSVRPFSVGDRVRLQGGHLAGVVEGRVAVLGLLHTTLAVGEDRVLVPNSTVLGSAIIPLREPARVDLRARLRPGVRPTEVQRTLDETLSVPTRGRPHIVLEEVDDAELVVRVEATPLRDEDGARLADEVISALGGLASSAGGRD
jgi:small conductance mechanosensitive channel